MKDFKLGFGLMRLPKKPGGAIDLPQTMQMADAFLAMGSPKKVSSSGFSNVIAPSVSKSTRGVSISLLSG